MYSDKGTSVQGVVEGFDCPMGATLLSLPTTRPNGRSSTRTHQTGFGNGYGFANSSWTGGVG